MLIQEESVISRHSFGVNNETFFYIANSNCSSVNKMGKTLVPIDATDSLEESFLQ